jgi:hypothetical protein
MTASTIVGISADQNPIIFMPPLVSEYAAVPYEVAHSIYGALLHQYLT